MTLASTMVTVYMSHDAHVLLVDSHWRVETAAESISPGRNNETLILLLLCRIPKADTVTCGQVLMSFRISEATAQKRD